MEITENLPEVVESVIVKRKATRGTSNKNVNGNNEDRRRRKNYLLETYAADRPLIIITWTDGTVTDPEPSVLTPEGLLEYPEVAAVEQIPTTRCYRCGVLLHFETLTVDRIVPGCVKTAKYPRGGTYVRENIRPCCADCNSKTGGAMATGKQYRDAKKPIRPRKTA